MEEWKSSNKDWKFSKILLLLLRNIRSAFCCGEKMALSDVKTGTCRYFKKRGGALCPLPGLGAPPLICNIKKKQKRENVAKLQFIIEIDEIYKKFSYILTKVSEAYLGLISQLNAHTWSASLEWYGQQC